MAVLEICPKQGKPYFYKSMIGDYAVCGTKNPFSATEMNVVEVREIAKKVGKFVDCNPVLKIDEE